MALAIGNQLQRGRYVIQRVLGQGGMSIVYLAADRNLAGRPVAIKENAHSSSTAHNQFQQEALMLARLTHPNLPRVTDHFIEASGKQYLVMDYVEGDNLSYILDRQKGPLPEMTVVEWIKQVINALEYMHNWVDPATRRANPIIHRDIKPSNIKRTPNGHIVLVDFGLAKHEENGEVTVAVARAFTPGYSPAEQYNGRTDIRSDIYALGATLYMLLTGQRPPEATVIAAGTPLTPPRQLNPHLSRTIERVILRAMQVQAADRYQSITELKEALSYRWRGLFWVSCGALLLLVTALVFNVFPGGIPFFTPKPAITAPPTQVSANADLSATQSPTAQAPLAAPTLLPVTPPSPPPIEALLACQFGAIPNQPIHIVGSSTVLPITDEIGKVFKAAGFTGEIQSSGEGTGAGFAQFCSGGDVDLVDASRPIQEAEVNQCRTNGVEPLAFSIGVDALPIVVSANNQFVDALTMTELSLVFSTARRWSDIRAEWPVESIKRVIPDNQSGTFDFFVEKIFNGNSTPLADALNKVASANDQDLADTLSQDPFAIGFFGFAFYQRNSASLRLVKLQSAGADPVEPNRETAGNGSYSLLRPLFLYSTSSILQTQPEVKAFIGCYLGKVQEKIIEIGYFPLESTALEATLNDFRNAIGQ